MYGHGNATPLFHGFGIGYTASLHHSFMEWKNNEQKKIVEADLSFIGLREMWYMEWALPLAHYETE